MKYISNIAGALTFAIVMYKLRVFFTQIEFPSLDTNASGLVLVVAVTAVGSLVVSALSAISVRAILNCVIRK